MQWENNLQINLSANGYFFCAGVGVLNSTARILKFHTQSRKSLLLFQSGKAQLVLHNMKTALEQFLRVFFSFLEWKRQSFN